MLDNRFISLISSVSPWPGSASRSGTPQKEIGSTLTILASSILAGLLATQVLAFSHVAVVNQQAIAQTTESSNLPSNSAPNSASLKAEQSAANANNSMADGVYLYGESPQPNQIGQAYMVFESRGGKMIGAFYMPQSEFDCFYGSRQGNELALTVVNSYDKMTHTFALGITSPEYPVASAGDRPIDVPLTLEGFQAIPDVSELDERLLATCKQNYADQIW